MDNTTRAQDPWDLDLRIEPAASHWPGKIGLTQTTETMTTIQSKLPTVCGNKTDACRRPGADVFGA